MHLGPYSPIAAALVALALLAGLGYLLLVGGARGQARQTEVFDAREEYP